ncbi:MAG: DUF1538 domain-containing protein [Oscillospiraceae bacterium]|jgi:hypothetical protein|nr:DUF1538 domain-containing protein [Oscillospiraceae bacterium]
MRVFRSKLVESVMSVVPITVIVLILSVTAAPISGGEIAAFAVGAVILIVGMALFTFGADSATMPMGETVGSYLSSSKKLWLILIAGFLIGTFVTVAEPDLSVLAELVSSAVPGAVLIWTVGVGVGLFLLGALLRTVFRVRLSVLLIVLYIAVFALAAFIPGDFLATAFDSGGVTTGPITVPFILALGVGVTAVRESKGGGEDSFGFVALCSVGPILATMVLSLLYRGKPFTLTAEEMEVAGGVVSRYLAKLPHYAKEVALALTPILALFSAFQIFALKLPKRRILSIAIGLTYTYVGLVLFLTAANVGFIPVGTVIGAKIASSSFGWAIIPLGLVMGAVVVLAEPAVHVLNKEVEEVSEGAISRRAMLMSLSLGVGVSVGLAMVRVYTGLSLWWLILPGYGLALALSFFVPPIYTAIAFDSGGVASGPMTATLLLSFALGASNALDGNIMRDAFGMVAMVAMTPLLTIQILGLAAAIGERHAPRTPLFNQEMEIIDLDWEAAL